MKVTHLSLIHILFPLTEETPFRIELWVDEVDSIRSFDVESQRSIENLPEVRIYPATELILTEERKAGGLRAIEKMCIRDRQDPGI